MSISHIKIRNLKHRLPELKQEHFKPALNGTHHMVVISENYVVRERKNNSELIRREARFLQQFHHPLIPRVIWVGKIGQSTILVENRLPGTTLDKSWKQLSKATQSHIVSQVVEFLMLLRKHHSHSAYSVVTGKTYQKFTSYLTQQITRKSKLAGKCKPAHMLLKKIMTILNDSTSLKLFETQPVAVHGDLINHNLLTDGKTLTGVLDFELALFGDKDYDLCRLFYYQECTIAYLEQGKDPSFEADYMKKLMDAVVKSPLIKNKMELKKKYGFTRAFFILGALTWAMSSDKPQKIIRELEVLWNKNRVKQLIA